jgi:hypothetical protein
MKTLGRTSGDATPAMISEKEPEMHVEPGLSTARNLLKRLNQNILCRLTSLQRIGFGWVRIGFGSGLHRVWFGFGLASRPACPSGGREPSPQPAGILFAIRKTRFAVRSHKPLKTNHGPRPAVRSILSRGTLTCYTTALCP